MHTFSNRAAGRRAMLAVLGALVLTLPACAAGPGPSTGPVGAAAVNAPGGALGFSGTTLDGPALNASTLAGKPVVLWFWTPWCTTCRAEGPHVAEIAGEYRGRVTFLGVPGRGEVDAMRGFVADTGTGGFAHVADTSGELWTRFGVVSQPSFVFVDRSESAQRFVGHLDREQLRAAVDQLTAG